MKDTKVGTDSLIGGRLTGYDTGRRSRHNLPVNTPDVSGVPIVFILLRSEGGVIAAMSLIAESFMIEIEHPKLAKRFEW